MKRNKLIVVAVVSACLLAVLLGVFNLCRYYFPMPGPTSDLFERYKDNPHIRATYLRNFQVNDTLRVDVTLLQATDSTGWETLKTDFNIVEPSPQALEMLKTTKSSVGIRLTPKDDIGALADTANLDNNYILAIDILEHSVGIFYTRYKYENKQIMDYHLDKLKTPKEHEKNN